MRSDSLTKIKKLEKQLMAAVFLFFVLIIGFLTVYYSNSAKEALAISTNYNKASGGSLNYSDWNNLPNDFVAKGGDATLGNLILNSKLGIGTNSPNKQIHVYNASGDNAEIDIQSVAGTDKHWGIYSNRGNNSLNFWQGNNKMVITADGKVGIGTDDPGTDYKLAVVGQTRLSSSVGQLRLTNNTGTYPNVDFTVNSDGKLDIEGGNVGIGVANPQAKLDIAGSLKIGASPAINRTMFGTFRIGADSKGYGATGEGFTLTNGTATGDKDIKCVKVNFTTSFTKIPHVVAGLDSNEFSHLKWNAGAVKVTTSSFELCGYYIPANSTWTSGSIGVSFIVIESI